MEITGGQERTYEEEFLTSPYVRTGLWILIIVLYAALRINILDIPLTRDEGIFGYMGQVINEGGIPYRDAIDQKPPVAFYLYAVGLQFVSPTPAGIHLFVQIYNFFTLVTLFGVAYSYTRSYMTGLWSAAVFAVFSSGPAIEGFVASTEIFLLLPLSLSLLFAIRAKEKGWLFLVASGISGALACWTKQTAAFMMLFIAGYTFFSQTASYHDRTGRYALAFKALLLWSAGFLALTTVIAAYFYFSGIFDEFIYWSFTHSMLYSQRVGLISLGPRIVKALSGIFQGNFIPIVAGIAGCAAMAVRKDRRGYFALGFLVFSMLATLPGYAYRHYYMQTAPAFALAGGFGIAYLTAALRWKLPRIAVSFIALAAVAFTPVLVHSGYYVTDSPDEISRKYFGGNPFPESVVIAEYIREHTAEDDSVFILGSEAQVLLYSERRSATSFALIYPLMSSYPRYREFQDTALKEIREARPRYIVFFNIPTSFLYDGQAELRIMKETKELIAGYYSFEAAMTVRHPRGELVLLLEKGLEALIGKRYPINIYRRK